MAKRLSFFTLAALIAAFATACAEPQPAALEVDLKAVIAKGVVQPVGGISTAAQPDEAALKVFAASGYKTVIDLRGKREKRGFDERGVIESLGMKYLTLPIRGEAAINFDNAGKLDQLLEQAEGPVLVHCASGNRVGALLALRESIHGASAEAALRYGKSGGLKGHESRVRKLLENK